MLAMPWNGYVDHWGNEVPGLITNDFWMTSTPEHTYGKMVFYGYGAMEATAEYRGFDTSDCIGNIALMSPIDIGRKAWIKVDSEWYGPFCSVDCARKGDMYSIVVIREEVVEVDIHFAEKFGMVTINSDYTYDVHKWFKRVELYLPPKYNQSKLPEEGTPISYTDWFLENVEFATGYEPPIIDMGNFAWKEYGKDKYWRSYFSNTNVWYYKRSKSRKSMR